MKNIIRKEVLKERDALSKIEIEEKSAVIFESLKSQKTFSSAENILSFMNFGSEVNTKKINEYLIENKGFVILPKVDMKTMTMTLYKINHFDAFECSKYGIWEPVEHAYPIFKPSELDFIVCPGVVFDKLGYRIGYGGGFYDRLLQSIKSDCHTVGIGFELQVRAKVPKEDYDQKIQALITEETIRYFNQ